MRVGYLPGADGEETARLAAALEQAGCERVVIDSRARRQAGPNPAFRTLAARMRKGETLVVAELDHIAGGLLPLLDCLVDLAARGVRVETLSGEFDTRDPAAGRTIRSLHAFAVRSRTGRGASGAAPASSNGPGRPRRLLPEQIAQARHSIETAGRPVLEVARELGVSRATLYRSLKQE